MDDRTRRAIAHLAEALYLLSCVRDQGDTTNIPVHIGPADAGHTVHFSATTLEAIADAVDSMNAYMASEGVHDDKLGMAVRQAEMAGWLDGQSGEQIGSGEWSAAAVSQCDTDLWDAVNDLYAELDPIEITDKVIRDREADLADVTQILDELFGDIPYPYADEDVPLPHDQAQMDALTSEVESFLQDGDA